jgi:hypothetical protein
MNSNQFSVYSSSKDISDELSAFKAAVSALETATSMGSSDGGTQGLYPEAVAAAALGISDAQAIAILERIERTYDQRHARADPRKMDGLERREEIKSCDVMLDLLVAGQDVMVNALLAAAASTDANTKAYETEEKLKRAMERWYLVYRTFRRQRNWAVCIQTVGGFGEPRPQDDAALIKVGKLLPQYIAKAASDPEFSHQEE